MSDDDQKSTHELLTQLATIGNDSYEWTQNIAKETLPEHDVFGLVQRVLKKLEQLHITYPDHKSLITRCVTALLSGHLLLQGPPGTGKTTLARVLSESFHMHLRQSTATTEWSPYHVVGGLRPTSASGLKPVLGVVPRAALECAENIVNAKAATKNGHHAQVVGTWLLIDEFNRADIDKAIGSLYTLLSSCDPDHLKNTPIDLWFDPEPSKSQLWVPARFRIIGTMNDLDSSYVSSMSQGLRRRFQFITVGIQDDRKDRNDSISVELLTALNSANESLAASYDRGQVDRTAISSSLEILQRVLDGLRWPADPDVDGWPVGSAQVVDVIKSMLISNRDATTEALDQAVAVRLVSQLNTVNQGQYEYFVKLLRDEHLDLSARELEHLYRPYLTI